MPVFRSSAPAVPAELVSLAQRYREVRWQTEQLAAPLSPEDQMLQSMPEASPTKWHLAHTTWFFETFLLTPRQVPPFDPRFTFLFNSYYKQLQGHPNRAARGLLSRPSREDVQRYRTHVDQAMSRLLDSGGMSAEESRLLELGLNHEQQHQELVLTDIKHALWSNPLRPSYRKDLPSPTAAASALDWVEFEAGLYQIGHSGDAFAFDNESPRHNVYLHPFRLATRLVTIAEYLGFIADGGYRRPQLWLSDGWDQVQAAGWQAPLYWERLEDDWRVFTLAGVRPLDPQEPVCHVSYYEADAYARWAGARLPTEPEWEVAAADLNVAGNLLESGRLHPAPASEGLSQMFGDVWEWTSSPYVAYPGYQSPAGALGEYNGKFMCNQVVLRGGSCATPQSHIRASYRNFFPAAARWQFSGIRLAR